MTKIILLFTGIIFALLTVLLVFVSNFNVGIVLQGLVSILLIIYGVFWENLKKCKILNAAILAAGLCFVGFITFLVIYGNTSDVTYKEDCIIVLGAGIHGETVSEILAFRLDKAYEYYEKNTKVKIIVTGGQGFQEDIPESLAMQRYLIAKGIPAECILQESNSTSTYENFKFSKEIMEKNNLKTAVLVTNDFHVFRAVKLAHRAGIKAHRISAATSWYTAPVNYMREFVAVVYMFLFSSR